MDPQRFDSLARTLATKTPRRSALLGGLGAAAGALGLGRFRSAEAASASTGRYTTVQRYAVSGKWSDAETALKGVLAAYEKLPGFIDFSAVDAGSGVFLTISVFLDE